VAEKRSARRDALGVGAAAAHAGASGGVRDVRARPGHARFRPLRDECRRNVADNLRAYTGIMFSIWLVYRPTGCQPVHNFARVWIAVHSLTRSFDPCATDVSGARVPVVSRTVLFTTDHTHSFHLYVPPSARGFCSGPSRIRSGVLRPARGAGRWRLCARPSRWWPRPARCGGAQERECDARDRALPRSFVLRRAVLAIACVRTSRATGWAPPQDAWFVLSRHAPRQLSQHRERAGLCSGVRLVLEQPDLDVVFVPPAPMPDSVLTSEMMVYTELGAVTLSRMA